MREERGHDPPVAADSERQDAPSAPLPSGGGPLTPAAIRGLQATAGNHAVAGILARRPKTGARPPAAMTPQEMWQLVFSKRGLETRVPPHAVRALEEELDQARAAGDLKLAEKLERRLASARRNQSEALPETGDIAPDKRPLGHGTKTYAAIQVADGKRRLAFAMGEYQGGGGPHAEEQALAGVRQQLDARGLRADGAAGHSWRITVVVDQVVCEDRCRPALRQFANDYGINIRHVVAHHPRPLNADETSRKPGPKTTSRTAHVRASGIPRRDPGTRVLWTGEQATKPSTGKPPPVAAGPGMNVGRQVQKVAARVSRGVARQAARVAARVAVRGLPIVGVLLMLKSAHAEVESAREDLARMEELKPAIGAGLEGLPTPDDLRAEHLGWDVSDARAYLDETAAVALTFFAVGHNTKDVRHAAASIGRALEDIRVRAGELRTLDAWLKAYSAELGELRAEAGERHAAMQRLSRHLWETTKQFQNVKPVLEELVPLALVVDEVMRAVGGLEGRLAAAIKDYDDARPKARNEWFQIVGDHNRWFVLYRDAVRVREGAAVGGGLIEPGEIDE